MKIRIKGNSLRYRLTKSEVSQLFATGHLEEHTAFANQPFVYSIIIGKDDKLAADFIENAIVLSLSKTMIDELQHTDRVGFEDRTGSVSLLLEKDFVCIDNVEEDQSDNYPNPSLNC